MGRLGLGVWVSASFHILALTAAKCPRWEGNCPGGEISGEGMCSRGDVQGEMSYTLKSITHLLAATGKLLTAIQ